MLFKGKQDGYYLYELTDTDLIWEEHNHGHYKVGNVLLFVNKKEISLGRESVKADDFATAINYLNGDVEYVKDTGGSQHATIISLKTQLAQSQAKIVRLDALLHDLTEDLESQRYSNQVLIAQLESLREQINIEKISRDEVIEDLEIASAETYRMDQELQETVDAKIKLEQELAERICELMEADSAKQELQQRLKQQKLEESQAQIPEPVNTTSPSRTDKNPHLPEAQVYTTSTGKLIQVYHEFPAAKGKARRKGIAAFRGAIRMVGMVALGLFVFVAGSVLATARLNDLSVGEATDMIFMVLFP